MPLVFLLRKCITALIGGCARHLRLYFIALIGQVSNDRCARRVERFRLEQPYVCNILQNNYLHNTKHKSKITDAAKIFTFIYRWEADVTCFKSILLSYDVPNLSNYARSQNVALF